MAKTKSRTKRSDWLGRVRSVGMVHLPPLPGASQSYLSMNRIIERAVREARMLTRAGFDAVIIENFGDAPFAATQVRQETVAAMAVVVREVCRAVAKPVGVNVLRNDAISALSVAAVVGAAFIRVNVLSGVYATDQGIITGNAAELMRRRAALAPNVRIVADVHVKHAVPISQPDIALAAEETAYRAGADALIVSGSATGMETDLSQVACSKQAVPDRPVWIGSGVTAKTVRECLTVADAVIVGTDLKRGGLTTAELDPRRLSRFVKQMKR